MPKRDRQSTKKIDTKISIYLFITTYKVVQFNFIQYTYDVILYSCIHRKYLLINQIKYVYAFI